jgi:hypothetical protein
MFGTSILRLRLYAVGVLLLVVAVLVLLHPWSQRTTQMPVASVFVRHDSLTRTEVATVSVARRSAVQAQVKQTAAVVRVERLRTIADTVPDRLRDLVALQDTVIIWANTRAASLEVALDASEIRAARTDSLLTVVRAAGDERCRILRVVPCPSRRAVAAVGLLAVVLSINRSVAAR